MKLLAASQLRGNERIRGTPRSARNADRRILQLFRERLELIPLKILFRQVDFIGNTFKLLVIYVAIAVSLRSGLIIPRIGKKLRKLSETNKSRGGKCRCNITGN
jgi:hypothetical protein